MFVMLLKVLMKYEKKERKKWNFLIKKRLLIGKIIQGVSIYYWFLFFFDTIF